MDLPAFIRSLGIEKAAELFDEPPRQVKAWLYGERTPRPKTALKIVQKSKGKVGLLEIYNGVQ